MSAINEPFGAVPSRLGDDLASGDLTFMEFGVLAWLEAVGVNYRLDPPAWRGTTSGMAEAMAWPHQPKHLGRVLRALQEKGYIESTARPRSPRPYTIRLTGGAARREGDDWRRTGAGLAPVVGAQRPLDWRRDPVAPSPVPSPREGSGALQTGARTQPSEAEFRETEPLPHVSMNKVNESGEDRETPEGLGGGRETEPDPAYRDMAARLDRQLALAPGPDVPPDPDADLLARFPAEATSAQMDTDAWLVRHRTP